VAGSLLALGLGALFVVGAVMGFQHEMEKSRAVKADTLAVPFSESYATTNGLLTARYPADFAAKKLDASTLLLSRNLGGGEDEALTLAALSDPITDDPHELARLLWDSHDKNVTSKQGTFTKTGNRDAKCAGKYPGVELEGTFTLPGRAAYTSKGCFWVHNNRAYELRYDVSSSRSAEEVPLLDRIINATELAP
jgi:hypothetical protein